MKKVFFFAALLAAGVCAMAQQNQVVWQNGKMLFANPISTLDSITFSSDAEEVDTLYMLLPRTIIKEVVTIKEVHDTIYKCPPIPEEPLEGVFSVSATKQVMFSKGNLQYDYNTDTWAFAAHQYDMIGSENVKGSSIAAKIDLFGWSGSEWDVKWGISSSTNYDDYAGDFVDWGQNMENGTTWRTMTYSEWMYVIQYRVNAANLMGIARINLNDDGSEYANGLILLPDRWICPEGVTFKVGLGKAAGWQTDREQEYADYQTITLADWQDLESSGAVFLPAAGSRRGASVGYVREEGYYWCAGPGYYIRLETDECSYNTDRNGDRSTGYAVRLVKDL